MSKDNDELYFSVVQKPYPNEHAARIKDPGQFERFARKNDEGGKGVHFIYGIKNNKAELQAIRFSASSFSASEAKSWLSRHGTKYIEFSAATGKVEKFEHNSTLADSEPAWSSVDKTKLPRSAFADMGDEDKVSSWRYPHHWIKGASTSDDKGRYTNGTMYLHKGGVDAARKMARGARWGGEAGSEIISHLDSHWDKIMPKEEKGDVSKIRLEELQSDAVSELSDHKLYELRARCGNLWKRHFGVGKQFADTLTRDQFETAYQLIIDQILKRNLPIRPNDLDQEFIRRKLFCGLNPNSLGDVVVGTNAVSIVGKFVSDPRSADKLEVFIDKDNIKWGDVFTAVADKIGSQTGKQVVESVENAENSVIGLFDLVLRPKSTITKTIKEKIGPLPVIKQLGVKILKIDKKEHVVGGIVYEPEVPDADGEFTSEQEIWKAMVDYMEHSREIRLMHGTFPVKAKVVECYQVPVDFSIGEGELTQVVKKGSWWLSSKVNDPEIWGRIESGEIKGYSMGGLAMRE